MRKTVLRVIKTISLILPFFNATACEKTFLALDDSLDIQEEEIVQILVEEVEYTTERLYNLSSFGVKSFSSASQGMDIYNDVVMFQAGYSGNSLFIHILDLEKHNALGTIQFSCPNGENSHMNNINCGAKYRESDKFPLLYLSQTGNSRCCFVLRVADDASSYELIQTIRYEGSKYHTNSSAYDWCIDQDNGFIYTYGYFKGSSINREIVKFPLPMFDKEEIVFNDKDVMENIVIENISIYQGSKIIDGILSAPVGLGKGIYPGKLLTIDLNLKTVTREGALNCGEPESLGCYKDGFIICGGGGDPYYYFLKP